MTEIHLLRHADAGARGIVDDASRPLSERGLRQADAIATDLAGGAIGRILSSPYLRCLQTVEPLAETLALEVEADPGLGEGAGAEPTLAVIASADRPLVICSHGDVLAAVLQRLVYLGVPLDDNRLAKGGRWVLRRSDGRITTATYRPPPG
jgi:8-oxo-dGTP diphosphatase